MRLYFVFETALPPYAGFFSFASTMRLPVAAVREQQAIAHKTRGGAHEQGDGQREEAQVLCHSRISLNQTGLAAAASPSGLARRFLIEQTKIAHFRKSRRRRRSARSQATT